MDLPTNASPSDSLCLARNPRDRRGKEHLLLDIVSLTICAVICALTVGQTLKNMAEPRPSG
jgi:hypothetical protein